MSENKHPCTTIADIRNIAEKIPDAAMSEVDKQSFKHGEFETLRLTEPLTAYRYFGSVSTDERNEMRGREPLDATAEWVGTLSHSEQGDVVARSSLTLPEENAIRKDYAREDAYDLPDEWGSDAGGRFLGLNPNLSPQEAKEKMALKSDWGNNEAYLATIEIPAGTEICVGIVGEQTDHDGKILPGGEVQILLPTPEGEKFAWTTEKTQKWIKNCEPVRTQDSDTLFVSDPNEYEISENTNLDEYEQPEAQYLETPETPESSREDGYISDLDIDSDESDNTDRIEDVYFREDAYMEESTDIGGKDIM